MDITKVKRYPPPEERALTPVFASHLEFILNMAFRAKPCYDSTAARGWVSNID